MTVGELDLDGVLQDAERILRESGKDAAVRAEIVQMAAMLSPEERQAFTVWLAGQVLPFEMFQRFWQIGLRPADVQPRKLAPEKRIQLACRLQDELWEQLMGSLLEQDRTRLQAWDSLSVAFDQAIGRRSVVGNDTVEGCLDRAIQDALDVLPRASWPEEYGEYSDRATGG